jgi:hypothetical protein
MLKTSMLARSSMWTTASGAMATRARAGVGLKLAGDAAYWKLDVFNKAVLTGVDDEGKQLKKAMPRFGKVGLTNPKGAIPTDTDLENVLAYLKAFGPKK